MSNYVVKQAIAKLFAVRVVMLEERGLQRSVIIGIVNVANALKRWFPRGNRLWHWSGVMNAKRLSGKLCILR